ncbi:hypothetical protein GOBAR_DD01607 [Gossypium barbadense]|nr:hypothetical protein GOBAR_DD01607 [Gossypium barbadense]
MEECGYGGMEGDKGERRRPCGWFVLFFEKGASNNNAYVLVNVVMSTRSTALTYSAPKNKVIGYRDPKQNWQNSQAITVSFYLSLDGKKRRGWCRWSRYPCSGLPTERNGPFT